MKYYCNNDFEINDNLVGKKGDVLEVTDAPGENVEGYVDIRNLTTGEVWEATWVDITDDLEAV